MEMTSVKSIQNQKAIEMANQAYNRMFYGTLLSEFRKATPSSMLGGGLAGDCFTQMFDSHLIEKISSRGPTPLAKSLIKKLHLDRVKPTGQTELQTGTVSQKG